MNPAQHGSWADSSRLNSESCRLLTTEAFLEPDVLDPRSAWSRHVPFAFWVVGAARPATVVELGTHSGVSYFAFCQAVAHLGLPARCFAIDTWKGDEQTGFYGSEVLQEVERRNAPYAAFSTLVPTTFDDAVATFDPRSIDLLHIDGFHTYEAVRHDVDLWLPRLSDRSVLLLHDSAVTRDDFGVWRLLAELAESYPTFEFPHGHGLAVVAVGGAVADPIKTLCSFDPIGCDAQAMRIVFSRLGAAVEGELERRRAIDEGRVKEQALAVKEQALAEELARAKGDLEQERQRHAMAEEQHRDLLRAQMEVLDLVMSSRSWRLTSPLRRLNATLSLQPAKGHPSHPHTLDDPRADLVRLFAEEWYRRRYDLPAEDSGVLLDDYLESGAAAGRLPNPLFDPVWYSTTNAIQGDEAAAPFRHFATRGGRAGLAPNRYFDPMLWAAAEPQRLKQLPEFLTSIIPTEIDPRILGSREGIVLAITKGDADLRDGDRVAAYAHFDLDGRIDEYVLSTIEHLARSGFKVILVSSCAELEEKDVLRAKRHVASIITTVNVGRDWGLYEIALTLVREEVNAERVLLINDSAYVISDLAGPFLERALSTSSDLVGATDSFQQAYHLQSYFLLLNRRALDGPLVGEFLKNYVPIGDKEYVINAYEIGFSRRAAVHGLSMRAVLPYGDLARHALGLREADRRQGMAEQSAWCNPTHHFWDLLIDQGSPFLKIELVRDNPARVATATPSTIRRYASAVWPTIERHLTRTARAHRSGSTAL